MTTSHPASGTYLVTGAAGFIGSHLVESLLARGDEVVGLDNFDPFYDPALKLRNVQAASRSPRYRLESGDIRDTDLLDRLFGDHRFDAVVHLAARAGVRPSLKQPVLYDAVNVAGTTSVLETARAHGVTRVVLASSSSVYGATSTPPFREDDAADRPSSPYAATKRANEVAAYAFHHLYGFDTTCLRFFTVYGPRQRPEMAIRSFTHLIDTGRRVELFGDGTSQRDYTYVDDVVAGVVAALDRPNGYRIYNLGTTATVPLRELVHKIGERLGKQPLVSYGPAQDGDVPLTHADISLARKELDYEPTTSIDEGLERFVEWYRDESKVITLPREMNPSVPSHLRDTDHAVVALSGARTLDYRGEVTA